MAAEPLATAAPNLRSLAIEDLSDKQLLQQLAGHGDRAAFAALVQRHGKLVLGVCRRALGSAADVDDLFQATFVLLARKPCGIRKQTSVAGWLFGLAYRLARQGCAIGHPVREPFAPSPPFLPGRQALGTIMDQELQGLPAAWRDALILCHVELLGSDEAALRLEWPLGTLKERLHRARELLRRNLRGRGIALSAMGVVIALADQLGHAVPTMLLRSTLDAALSGAVPANVAALAALAAQTPTASKLKLA